MFVIPLWGYVDLVTDVLELVLLGSGRIETDCWLAAAACIVALGSSDVGCGALLACFSRFL